MKLCFVYHDKEDTEKNKVLRELCVGIHTSTNNYTYVQNLLCLEMHFISLCTDIN